MAFACKRCLQVGRCDIAICIEEILSLLRMESAARQESFQHEFKRNIDLLRSEPVFDRYTHHTSLQEPLDLIVGDIFGRADDERSSVYESALSVLPTSDRDAHRDWQSINLPGFRQPDIHVQPIVVRFETGDALETETTVLPLGLDKWVHGVLCMRMLAGDPRRRSVFNRSSS